MIGKKINELATELAPINTDLTIIGDPITGVSKKITLSQIASLFGGAIVFVDNYASLPTTGAVDTIYCLRDSHKIYMWNGTYIETLQVLSEKGAANGYASLDSLGKVPISQLPSSIMEYKGMWNAATNTPTLVNGTGDTGDVYICNVAGSVNFGAGSISFAVGDYVVYSGTIYQRSSGAVGTVTSVALSVPSGLSVSGSPITSSGTFAITGAGNTTQYLDGTGALQSFPSVTGQAANLLKEVYNETGATLTKGTIVYINGGHGNLATITKALATNDSTSAQTFGMVQNNITNNNNGYIVVIGDVIDLVTNSFAVGTQLYLSGVTAGTYTSTKPYAPTHLVYVGVVTRSHPTQGIISVKIQNGYEMDELHNVDALSPANNDILSYNTSTSLWEHKQISTTLGYTPEQPLTFNSPLSRSINAVSIPVATSSVNGYLSSADWNTFNGKEGAITSGTTSQYWRGDKSWQTLNTTNVPEGTSLYYTDARARASVSAGTGISYNSTTGVITNSSPSLGGTVTSVSMTTPTGLSVTGSPITGSGTLAVSLTAGYVIPTTTEETAWNLAYTNRITSLTTSGSSGSASLVSNTLNIPTYTLSGLGGQPQLNGTGFVKISGTTISYDNSTYVTSVTGTSPIVSSGGTTPAISIPAATTSVNGYLTSTDWNTFNGKQNALTNPVTGTGTTNYLPKFTGTSTIGNSLIYDNGTNVGIGTASPSYKLDVNGTIVANYSNPSAYSFINVINSASTGYSQLNLVSSLSGTAGTATLFYIKGTALGLAATGSDDIYLKVGASSGVGGTNAIVVSGSTFSTTMQGFLSQATSSIVYSNPSAYLPFNITNTANTGYTQINLTSSNASVSGTASINYAKGLFFRLNSGGTDNLELTVNGGTSALLFNGSTAAASFSSRVNINGATDDGSTALNVTGTSSFNGIVGISSAAGTVPLSLNVPSGNNTNIVFNENGIPKHYVRSLSGGGFSIYDNTLATTILGFSSTGAATFSSSVTAGGGITTNGNWANIRGGNTYLWFTENGVVDKFLIGSTVGNNDLVFRSGAYNLSTGIEVMRLFNDGNLGLGTSTNAGYKLDVNGTGNTARIQGGTSTYPNLILKSAIYPIMDFISDDTNSANRNWRIASVYNDYGKFEILSSDIAGGVANTPRLQISNTGAATFSSTLGINGVADNIKSGTYTPTLTGVYNVTSSTAFLCQYMRVGNVVTVSGVISAKATAANTWTRVSMTLPISSNFDWSYRAGGGGGSGASGNMCSIQAGASTNQVYLDVYPPNSTTTYDYYFSYTYTIM